MPNDNDGLTAAALLLGGGLAGYALGHWLEVRYEAPPSSTTETPAPGVTASGGATAAPLDEPVSSPSQVSERNARSSRVAQRYTREGRTILRDRVAVLEIVRVDLGDQRYAISPHETDVLAEEIVRLLNGQRPRRHRDARKKEPWYREQWLVDDRCGYRARLFWTGTPPDKAVVGDVWAYVEDPNGRIIGKRRFRTTDEAHRYVKAALKRALERAGKFDCYGE